MAADYDLNASYLVDGETAFWVNGTWAWPDFEPYAEPGSEYGIFHFPINDARTQGKVMASATKYVVLDAISATADQQKAAKMLLNWLVFDPAGQDVLINGCQMVTAFSNIDLPPTNPFNVALQSYIRQGRTIDSCTYDPSDHRSLLAPSMQAYVDGRITREALAAILDDYWKTHLPVE